MHHIHNLAKINSFVKGGTARSDIEKYLLPNAKLYLKDFGTSIDFANDTITNFGYGLNNLAMVGYTRNDGTVNGGVTIVDGAMRFDATNNISNISIPAINASTNFSFSIWTRETGQTAGSFNRFFAYGGRGYGILKSQNLGTTVFFVYDSGGTIRNLSLGNLGNGINNIIGEYNQSTGTRQVYVNNVLAGSLAFAPRIENNNLRIGREDGGNRIVGDIFNLAFYSRVLTSGERTAIFQAGPNAYSPISSGLVAQYSGRNFAGTTSAPTTIYDTRYITQVSATDTRTVLNNLGAQYINYGGVMFSASDSYSVLANYRLDNITNTQAIIGKMTGSDAGGRQPALFARVLMSNSVRWSLRNTVPTDFNITQTGGAVVGWNQTSAGYNQSTGLLSLYREGLLNGTTTFTGTMQSGTDNTAILAQNTSTASNNFEGGLQSLMVIDKKITATQYKQWYNYVRV